MQDSEIRMIIQEEIRKSQQQAQYSVSKTPVHTHNNIDSPNVPAENVIGFQPLPGVGMGVVSPDWLNGQSVNNLPETTATFDFPKVIAYPLAVIYGYGTTSEEEVTAGISAGATSATLTGAWGGATVRTAVQFDSGEVRIVLFTNGSTAISWTPALILAAGTTLTLINNARFHGGDAPDGTTILFRNDDDGIWQLWTKTVPGVLLFSWAGVELGGTGLFVY